MIDDEAYDLDIIDDFLEQNTSNDSFHIPAEDMIEYLSVVSKQQVEIEPEAGEMLKDYFAATRKIRESQKNIERFFIFNNLNFTDSLTPKAFAVLQQMAESHAKLCFRQKVTSQDVLAAISVSEVFIRALFDKDSYSSPAEPKFEGIDDIDSYFDQLFQWHTNFIKNILKIDI